ncbi:recombinase RecT [Bacteroides sp. 51]|uniref:recombinase RecT n=1 Tax=Bacteroides sp. 51 TaxID=2302938 RepID=UPI0013D13C70|nr:recombinase RecT [Bacteroides sp. 51]NDV81296.1 serine/threonine protein kinase [Bacteroides sp. 51]
MSNAIQITSQDLNALKHTDLVDYGKTEQKFITIYNAVWGSEQGSAIYNREKFHFNKLLTETPALQECSKLSLLGCFLDIAVNGLSLDQSGRPQCYIIPRSVKVKGPTGDYWEKRAGLQVSAYGEVYMRMRAGQVRHVDNPVIVYECDSFEAYVDENERKRIKYVAKVPRTSNKPVAAFIKITRNDGTIDYQWMLESDWIRLAAFSEKSNRGSANALYSSFNGNIDPGFLENKMMKHAFDAYPKVRTGNYTVMATEEEAPPVIDYGFVEEGDQVNEPIVNDSNIPFGEDKQLDALEPVAAPITEADEEEGF